MNPCSDKYPPERRRARRIIAEFRGGSMWIVDERRVDAYLQYGLKAALDTNFVTSIPHSSEQCEECTFEEYERFRYQQLQQQFEETVSERRNERKEGVCMKRFAMMLCVISIVMCIAGFTFGVNALIFLKVGNVWYVKLIVLSIFNAIMSLGFLALTTLIPDHIRLELNHNWTSYALFGIPVVVLFVYYILFYKPVI